MNNLGAKVANGLISLFLAITPDSWSDGRGWVIQDWKERFSVEVPKPTPLTQKIKNFIQSAERTLSGIHLVPDEAKRWDYYRESSTSPASDDPK